MTILAFVCIILAREYIHYLHDTRRDILIDKLTDKIKAKDLQEYKDITEGVKLYAHVSNDDADLYDKEIEEAKQ